MKIGESSEETIVHSVPSATLEQCIVQESEGIVWFEQGNLIMVTNHPKYEGNQGIYVGFYPSNDKQHYVWLSSPDKFLWLKYEQLIKIKSVK